MHLALITGPSCSGKSTLARAFNGRAHVIHMDLVARDAANRACPYLKRFPNADDWFTSPEFWDLLDRIADTFAPIRYVIELMIDKSPEPFEWTIVEGIQLRQEFWRSRVLRSFESHALALVRSYRIQVPVPRVREQAKLRKFDWSDDEALLHQRQFDDSTELEFDFTGTPEEIQQELQIRQAGGP